jgi:hypothetical protein
MRDLSDAMKIANHSLFRAYRFRVYLWDTLTPGAPTMQEIVRGTADTTFRTEVTEFVADGLRIQDPGDRRASRLTMSLVSPDDRFNPHGGGHARFVKEGCVVRVLEGDAHVPEAEWVWTFTGHVRGQSGYNFSRESADRRADVTAFSRLANPKFSKMTFTSRTYGRFTDYGQILLDIVINIMGLRPEEFRRIDTALGKVTQFASSSIIGLTPLEAIDKILETVGQFADFDGEGVLRYVDRDMTRSPDLIDAEYECFVQAFRVPSADVNVYNSISVVGLDKNLTETEHPGEDLATAQISVGFWRPRESVFVQWSKDRSARAKDTEMIVLQSIQDSLVIGGFGSETYEEIDDFSGRVVVNITGYLGTMMTLIGITLALEAAIGDYVLPFGGITVPFGKVLEAITISAITQTLATQSTGQYTIVGTLLIPVFKEIVVVMTQEGIPDYLLNQKQIRNDWLNEQEELLEVAQRELMFEFAQGQPREVDVVNDLSLEIGDIIYLPFGGGLRLWIESISKSISRGELPTMRLSAYRAL